MNKHTQKLMRMISDAQVRAIAAGDSTARLFADSAYAMAGDYWRAMGARDTARAQRMRALCFRNLRQSIAICH